MRIGMCHSLLPNEDRKPGGVESFVHNLSNRLVERGHHVAIFSFSQRPKDAAYLVTQLGPERIALNPIARFVAAPVLFNRVKSDNLQLLHFHGDDWFFVRRTVPVIRTFYGSAADEARFAASAKTKIRQAAVFPLEMLAARRADASYGFGPGYDRRYKLKGHLQPGVERNADTASHRSSAPSILFVGTWGGRKRGWLAHKLFTEKIRRLVPGAELWMVSDYCEPATGVTWYPRPDDEELRGLYREAWLLLSLSRYEGFGLPALEAMANGVAVVSTPNLGIRALSNDGRSAVVVDDSGIATAVVRILTDPAARAAIIERGKARAAEYSWETATRLHEDAYTDLISNRGRRKD